MWVPFEEPPLPPGDQVAAYRHSDLLHDLYDAVAEAQPGNMQAAQRSADKVRQIYPLFDAGIFVLKVAPTEEVGHLLEDLRQAGL